MSRHSVSAEILYDENDMVVEIRGLANEVTGEYLNAATVNCTLKDSAGVSVSGQSWPTTMTYVTSSDGVYRAIIGYAAGTVASSTYTLQIDVNGGAGLRGQWSIPCVCRRRT